MRRRSISNWKIIESFLPWVVLTILFFFTYAKFFEIPYLGFEFINNRVGNIYDSGINSKGLEINEQILAIGQVSMEDFQNNLHQRLLEDINPGDHISIKVNRKGQLETIDWIVPEQTTKVALKTIIGIWWISYVFWFAGTTTILFIRPRGKIWVLLIAFFYLTSIWLITLAGPSRWHILKGALILRSSIWLCVPVYLHYHWEFPSPLKHVPRGIWISVYSLGILMAFIEWFSIIPPNTYLVSFFVSLAGSGVFLIFHYIYQEDYRQQLIIIFSALILAILLSIGLNFFYFVSSSTPRYIFWSVYLTLPTIPTAYFLANYWNQLFVIKQQVSKILRWYLSGIIFCIGTIVTIVTLESYLNQEESLLFISFIILLMTVFFTLSSSLPLLVFPALAENKLQPVRWMGTKNIRANRLISIILFTVLLGTILSSVIILLTLRYKTDLARITISISASLLAIMVTSQGYPRFQRYIERNLFGKSILPLKVIQTFSEKVTTNLNQQQLIDLLKDAILPEFLIPQSAMFIVEEGRNVEELYTVGLEQNHIPRYPELLELVNEQDIDYPLNLHLTKLYPWLHLIVPLTIHHKKKGVWLLGKKEAMNLYSWDEVEILKSIASQTGIVLANIDQQNRMNTILQENINRHEEERNKLARGLHDEILNGLAALGMTIDDQVPKEFDAQYNRLTNRIRRMISGLRPPLLDQGLWLSLNELVNHLRDRIGNEILISWNLEPSDARYYPSTEGHVYRIIQQACENAIQHSKATSIDISGELKPDQITLVVDDNGIGFSIDEYASQSLSKDQDHYGIVVMKERAELIDAELYIHSVPGQGTRVEFILKNVIEKQNEREARISAEKSLREREESFRTLVDHASYGILMADENKDIIYANAQAAAISGYSTNELIKFNAEDLALPVEYEKMKNWNPEQQQKPFVQPLYETVIHHKNGEEVPIELTIAHTLWNGKTVGMALFSDISEQKKLEIALKESTDNFKKIFDNAIDGIVLAEHTGKHIYVNNSFAEITGYRVSELLSMSMHEVINPKDISNLRKSLKDRISGINTPSPYETSLVRKDGTLVPIVGMSTRIIWQGQVVAMAFVRDISVQMQTAEALRQSEEKFKAVIDNAKDGILIADQNGKHIYANPRAAEITGYEISELLATTIKDLAHPDEYEKLINRFRSRLGGENLKEQYETRIITRNGDALYIELTSALTRWDGKPCVMVVIRDISERRLAEDFSHLFEQIYSVTKDAIAISDSENRLIYINKAHENLFGWSFGDAMGVNYLDYCTVESKIILREKVYPRLQRGETWEGILEVIDRNNRVFPVMMVAGSVLDTVGNIHYSYAIMKEKIQ